MGDSRSSQGERVAAGRMRSLMLLCVLVAGVLAVPVSEPAAQPAPAPVAEAEAEAEAHYGHYGYGYPVTSTLWGASYPGHYWGRRKREAEASARPYYGGYYGHPRYGYWGRKKREAVAGPDPSPEATPEAEADPAAHYGHYGYGGWGGYYGYYGYPYGYYWGRYILV